VQKRLNRNICRFGCGLEWAEGCTSLIVVARWHQCALMGGHGAVTCRITLNHPSTAAIRLMANYFDHLLSLDTPTYTVAQIAKRFEPSTVLWAFHTIQPSSFVLWFLLSFYSSPILSGRRLDVYHTSTHGVGLLANLECRSETCCTRLAGNTGRKNDVKIAICAPSHNFVGLYLRN